MIGLIPAATTLKSAFDPGRTFRSCGCSVITTGPVSCATGKSKENPNPGLLTLAVYFPACSACVLMMTSAEFVSPGNSTPFRRH